MEPSPLDDDEMLLKRNAMAKERTEMAAKRTLLAAERTLSAWLRTGIAGVGGGLAIAKLLIVVNVSHQIAIKFIGPSLIIWGMGIFCYGWYGYMRVRRVVADTIGFIAPTWEVAIIALSLIIFSAFLLWTTLSSP